MTPVLIIAIAVCVIAVVVAVARSRRSNDGVDSFRRQIDALSPEARRPVVDQVQHVADANEDADDADGNDDDT